MVPPRNQTCKDRWTTTAIQEELQEIKRLLARDKKLVSLGSTAEEGFNLRNGYQPLHQPVTE